jgi:hypothetical protein
MRWIPAQKRAVPPYSSIVILSGFHMAITHSKHIPIPHEFDSDLLGYGESLGHGEFHFKLDAVTGVRAIVAINMNVQSVVASR